MKRWNRQLIVSVILAVGVAGPAQAALGDPSSASSNYKVIEGELGGNGQFNSSSSNFNINPSTDDAGSSLGETTVGNGASTNFQTNSGFNTTAQPSLTMIVNTVTVSLGVLSSVAANTGSASFSVKDYTSYGYVVQLVGPTPTYAGHPLTALTSDTASINGTEQFGVNLRANTSPVSIGADPVQVPSTAFSFGVAGDGATGTYGTSRPYTIPNNFRYNSGETVASGPKSSGETDYTMTFMTNISTGTRGGNYNSAMQLVATGTY